MTSIRRVYEPPAASDGVLTGPPARDAVARLRELSGQGAVTLLTAPGTRPAATPRY